MGIDLIYNVSIARREIYFYKFLRFPIDAKGRVILWIISTFSRVLVRPQFFVFLLLARNGYSREQRRELAVDISLGVL